ncbi:BON domain-containing protein [Nonomuraea sp. B5E05]
MTLSGQMDRRTETRVAARMTARVKGVVDVINNLTWKHDDIVDLPVWGGA